MTTVMMAVVMTVVMTVMIISVGTVVMECSRHGYDGCSGVDGDCVSGDDGNDYECSGGDDECDNDFR